MKNDYEVPVPYQTLMPTPIQTVRTGLDGTTGLAGTGKYFQQMAEWA